MYRIQVSTDCQITLTGTPINPVEHPVIINADAVDWIGFPLNESLSVSEAFAGFPVNGDMVKSKSGVTTYNGTTWRGQLTTLEPGQGYIYKSNASTTRTFYFPAR